MSDWLTVVAIWVAVLTPLVVAHRRMIDAVDRLQTRQITQLRRRQLERIVREQEVGE